MLLDLHMHTWFSHDGLASPEALLRTARRKGLDGIAVTDHETIRGALEARERNRDRDFTVIVGAEIATEAGDIIGLFLQAEIGSRRALEVIGDIHAQGGVALLPHPFHRRPPRDDVVAAVDLIEAFNARCSPEENRAARELARRLGKPAVCASDAHFASDVGTCRVLIDDGDVRTALLRGPRQLQTAYTPRYKTPASQIVKAWKRRTYSQLPLQSASMVKRMIFG